MPLTLAGVALLAALAAIPFMGSEFIPRLDESAFTLEMRRPPSISLEEANKLNSAMEKAMLERFPDEIASVVSKTGRAEIATDPVGPNSCDFNIFLRPPDRWKKAHSRDELIEVMDAELKKFLGVSYEFSQPIEMRMNELIAGVRSDIAIKLFGDDMDVLRTKADQIV